MEESTNSTLFIPENLAEVLSNLGINEAIPAAWNLNVTEFEFTLNLSWSRLNGGQQNNKDSVVRFSSNENKFYEANGTSESNSGSNRGKTSSHNTKIAEKDKKSSDFEENAVQKSPSCDLRGDSGNDEGDTSNETPRSNGNHDNNHLVYNGLYNRGRLHSNKATCSCGEQFIFKERAIKHILFSCPVSLCFRVDLDLRIHDVIDQWQDDEQRILGRKWWHAYKTSGVPDIMGIYPVTSLDQLEGMINSFIIKAGSNELLDQNQNRFVLIKDLDELPYELGPLIG